MLKDSSLMRRLAYINGDWISADDGATISVVNPATRQEIGTVPRMGASEARRAIEAANDALPAWRDMLAKERGLLLRKWFDLIIANADDLAMIMTAEQGKPLAEARNEVISGAAFIEWFAEEARRTYGETIPTSAKDHRIVVIKQPIGVCAAITPWNFRNTIITRKVAAALVAGCTIVVRPASSTAYSALALTVLADRAGIPPGVFSAVTDTPRDIGTEFTSNPIVRKLSFTGSTAVGRQLMAQCAGTVKKLALELGGNAAFIVFEDADIDAAVADAMGSKFRNAGQACVGANRFYIHDKVYDEFAAKVRGQGGGAEDRQRHRSWCYVRSRPRHGRSKEGRGAPGRCARKGRASSRWRQAACTGRYLLRTDCDRRRRCDDEDRTRRNFAPLAPLFRFSDEKSLIRVANDTEYGLAGYFYTRDSARVWRVAEALEFGMVGVNIGLMANESVPFGGIKESGIGREGSKYGIEDYMELKYICMGGMQ